jgi:23S rRNA pseudouridine1911/1915/1917 synthase
MDADDKYKISNIPVVFEDDWLLIVSKPAGLLTIPSPKKEARTLTSILNDELKKRAISYRLHPCHRLDRETSGLIIYAKGKSVQKKMMDEFRRQKVKKIYIAFVQGNIKENSGQINKPLEGLSAMTRFRVIEQRSRFTVLEVMPLTGRKNQIRIHFKSIGHPVVGETKFAFRKDYALKAKRMCLHAKSLEFIHPITRKMVSVDCEIAGDLQEFLSKHKE